MKILITGGAGFIGSNLALKLIAKGHEIIVVDNLSPQIHGAHPEVMSPLYQSISDKVEFIKSDVCDASDWDKVLQGTDVVVHLAAETGTGQSMYEIDKYTRINIGGTALMLDHLANKKHSIKKVVIHRLFPGSLRGRQISLGRIWNGLSRPSQCRGYEPR
jgi:dTDP-L-rhamnose 4-epimerase